MALPGQNGNKPESVESFKQALREEYARKLEALKDRFEQDFSALIAARRIEVEKKIQRIHLKQANGFETELAAARESAFRGLRTRILEIICKVSERLDERVRAQVVTLRQDPAEYGPLLNNLAKEALDVLGTDKAILRVPEGETRLLVHDPRVVRIDETTDLPMGGIVAMDAETGLHLVDNSLRTRFERLKPVMVEALSARLAGHVRDAQEPLPELRLP